MNRSIDVNHFDCQLSGRNEDSLFKLEVLSVDPPELVSVFVRESYLGPAVNYSKDIDLIDIDETHDFWGSDGWSGAHRHFA